MGGAPACSAYETVPPPEDGARVVATAPQALASRAEAAAAAASRQNVSFGVLLTK